MNELQQILQHLRQPEYVHVLLNPLPVYMTAGGLLALALALPWKFPKSATPLAAATLVFAAIALGIGGWISHAGGQVRHSEFRGEPPPQREEHHEPHH